MKQLEPLPETESQRGNFRSQFAEIAETLSKHGILVLGAVYFAGFLTVTQYEADFGIIQFSPVRTRILSAGLLFVALAFVTSMAALTLYEVFPSRLTEQNSETENQKLIKFYRWCSLAPNFYLVCLGISAVVNWYSVLQPSPPAKLILVQSILAFAAFALLMVWALFAQHKFEAKPGRVAILAILVVGAVIATQLTSGLLRPVFSNFWFIFWLWITGMVGVILFLGFKRLDDQPASATLALVLILLPVWLFAKKVYPQIDASWGGGKPRAALLYLSSAMPFSQQLNVEVLMIDETDYGYYAVLPDDRTKAVFVRRDAVKAITFPR
ncbi:MAG: hypothetical protein HY313_08930 [Acidobacteria bacterium]|nr:hypothetical protein [Acidobacteriota bacterium]